MDEISALTERMASIKRQLRLIVLLDAAKRSGLSPLQVRRVHAIAYLTNVLTPVWNMIPLDGKLLKQRRGPFYPDLQMDLDHLVGIGLVHILNVRHVLNEGGIWQLEGDYSINQKFAAPILAELERYPEEMRSHTFISELFLALSGLPDDEIDEAFRQDATFADPIVDDNNVIDFGEWRSANASANAAEFFRFASSAGALTTPGEKLHLYVSHLHSRLTEAHAK